MCLAHYYPTIELVSVIFPPKESPAPKTLAVRHHACHALIVAIRPPGVRFSGDTVITGTDAILSNGSQVRHNLVRADRPSQRQSVFLQPVCGHPGTNRRQGA
jgi:hypothetical protein